MVWIMGQRVPSANLLKTQNREEWLTHQRVMLSSSETLTGEWV